jgi:hypothetical protein
VPNYRRFFSGGQGIRTPPETPQDTIASDHSGALSGALGEIRQHAAQYGNIDADPDLAEIVAMWANLSPTVRHCMMLLIRNS